MCGSIVFSMQRPERNWEFYEALAALLKSMRRGLGLTQQEFAALLDLRISQLQRLEMGELRLTDQQANRLGKQLYVMATPPEEQA